MKNQKVASPLLALLLLATAPFAFAQLATPALSSHRTLAYFNRDTGLFEPVQAAGQDPEAPPVTPTTGTLVYNFTITLKTPLPKGGILTCTGGGEVIETKYSTDEGGFGIAKLVSGDTYSCSVSLPYSWMLSTPTTDKILLSFKVQVNEALEITAANGTGTTFLVSAGRASAQTLPSIAVPANGATTTETVSLTL
jgi:hypothetical protein